jgi:hypothetical protein
MKFERHPVFEEPEEHSTVWRYLSFTRFVSLLATRSLFFSRLDRFEDRFEGYLTRPTFEKMHERVRRSYLEMRTQAIVNCWCLSECESVALWRTFVPTGEGVAIRSTFAGLRDCFGPGGVFGESSFMIGKVRYVDFNTHDFSNPENTAFNSYVPMLHKRKFFEFERELRVVISHLDGSLAHQIIRNVYGWGIPVDLSKLIDAVHVAPDAEPWFLDVVASSALAFGFDPAKVVQSSIDDPPFDSSNKSKENA